MRMNLSWAFAGNAAYAACQWVVFVLLVRSLTLAEVGQFAYWIAVTGPIFVLANVRLRNLIATDGESPQTFSDYLRARQLTTTAAVVAALIVAAALSAGLDSLAVVAFIVAARACDAVSDITHGLFQSQLDMRSAAIGLLANGVLSVALVGVASAVWPSLIVAAAAYAAGSVVPLVAWDLPRTRRITRRCPRPAVAGRLRRSWDLIWRALPLGLSAAVGSLQVNIPRYIVAAYLGHAALAVFTALAYLPTLGNLIVNAVAQASLPLLARDLRTSLTAYRQRLWGLVQAGMVLAAVSVLGTVVAGRAGVTAIYGADVAQFDLLLVLMVAAAVSYGYIFLGTAATARQRFGAQLLISSTGLLTVVVSIVPLLGRFGLVGAGYALCAGAVVEGSAYLALTLHDLRSGGRRHAIQPGLAAGMSGR